VATVHEVGHHLVMKLWNVADGKRIAEFTDFAAQPGHSFWAEIRFSPDGKRIFTCGDGTIKVWDANFGTLLLTFPEVQLPMVMSRDGNTIAAATRQGAVKVWRGK
jgi:WD40 repeat protein